MTPVFIPTFGFRPSGTRRLSHRAETIADNTKLAVIAAAAAPDRTEVRVDWERSGDPASCASGSRILVPTDESLEGVAAALVMGTKRLEATAIARLGYHASYATIGARHAITFPALPKDADAPELLVTEGSTEWRVPFTLEPDERPVAALAVEIERAGVVVRATAVTRRGAEVVVGLEIEAARQIRQVGAPLPTSVIPSDDEAEVRARRQEIRRVLGRHERPITLQVDDGSPLGEVDRMDSIDPQQTAAGQAFIRHLSVVFETATDEATVATLVVPFVDLNDFDHSVTADLRKAPLDLALGEHRFRVTKAEPYGDDLRAEVTVLPSAAEPRFLHPARMQSTPSDTFSWGGTPERGEPFWFATRVGDPPIVTFHGLVLRVDGPWRLELPLR